MRKSHLFIILLFFIAPWACAEDGLIHVKSPHSVQVTTDRLENILTSKGMTVFKRIDHAQGALSVGKNLRPTQLLIFGNPKIGTALMQCEQNMAIDLPQKALSWEDAQGQIWLTYNDPIALAKRHAVKRCEAALNKVANALKNFAMAATKP